MPRTIFFIFFIFPLMLTGCGKNPMDHVREDAEKFDVTSLYEADDIERIAHSCRHDAERGRNEFTGCVRQQAGQRLGPVIQSAYDYCRENYSYSSGNGPDACYVYSSRLRDMVAARYRDSFVTAAMSAFEKLAAARLAEKIARMKAMPARQIEGILQTLETRKSLTPEEAAQLAAGREILLAEEAGEAARQARERDEAEARFNPERWQFDTEAEKIFYTMPVEQAAFVKTVNEARVEYSNAKNPVKREMIFEAKEKALQKILPMIVVCYGFDEDVIAKGGVVKVAIHPSEVPDSVRNNRQNWKEWCLKSDSNLGTWPSVIGGGEIISWVGMLVKMANSSNGNTASPVIAIGPDIILQHYGSRIDTKHILAEKIADLSEGQKIRFSGYIVDTEGLGRKNNYYAYQGATEKPEYKIILTTIDSFKAEHAKP